MIACVLHVRNEEFFLPGFLDSVRDYVDALYCLDDGSEDSTVELLKKERKLNLLLKNPPHEGIEFREQEDLERLYEAVKKDGYDWIFTADPDERISTGFLERMKILTAVSKIPTVYVLKLCECRNKADYYRSDGVWNAKIKPILFTVPNSVKMSSQPYHAPNYPIELRGCEVLLNDRTYHLKMVHPKDRIKRRDLYKALDPERLYQSIGYDYLTNDDGLVSTKVPEHLEYDFRTLPETWKSIKYLSDENYRKCVSDRQKHVDKELIKPLSGHTLSVIVASYNYGRFLTDAVESVLNQTLLPDEILIVDDCSQDNTLEIGEYYATKYPSLVKYHRNIRNEGIVKNFRKAVSMTKGDLICILGADNRFHCDYLEKTYGVLKDHPDVAIAYTDYVLFGGEAEHVYNLFEESRRVQKDNGLYYINFPEYDREELEKGNYIHGSSMYRRMAYERVGGYADDPNMPDDYSLFLKIVQSGWKAKKVNGTLLEYRQHSQDQANRQFTYKHQIQAMELGFKTQIDALKSENSRLQMTYDSVMNSSSWKITGPLRAVAGYIKKFF